MVENKNEKIVQKLNDLYILNRWKYLILNDNGEYSTLQYYKNNEANNCKPLTDYNLYNHLGNKTTVGVFAGKKNNIVISKFLTFDIDIKDKEHAKWVTYKLINCLNELGFNNFHISSSGNKGYHVDLFFTEPIELNKLKIFHSYILDKAELKDLNEYNIQGEIEMRPMYELGVKIPLGINFRSKDKLNNKCWFVDYTKSMKPIKNYNYLLSIEQIDSFLFLMKLDELIDFENVDIHKDNSNKYQYIKNNYQPLEIYKHNVEEDVTIEAIQRLEEQGLTRPNTRHNSLLKICKYYKYLGMDKEENNNALIGWMLKQNEQYYTSKWQEIIKDIESIVKYVYEHNCNIVGGVKDVEITYDEMKAILKAKGKNDKLMLYAFLIHSKRYSNKDGVFYFAISNIMKATGLTNPTVTKITNTLAEDNHIEIISRNVKIIKDGQFITKDTNRYKVTLQIENSNENKSVIMFENDSYEDVFNKCILQWFSKKEIKQLCGRRHYEHLLEYEKQLTA